MCGAVKNLTKIALKLLTKTNDQQIKKLRNKSGICNSAIADAFLHSQLKKMGKNDFVSCLTWL